MSRLRILICGDRNWPDAAYVEEMLRRLWAKVDIECVIEGEARGADTHGRLAAEACGLPVLKFPADWEKYGRAAGPIRNAQMLKEGRPDIVLAFHIDLRSSKGTRNMVEIALKANKVVYLCDGSKTPKRVRLLNGRLEY